MGWDIVAIGINHNLPVEDPNKTAERISSLVDGPISVGYYESWMYKPDVNKIIESEYEWIEISKINSSKQGYVVFFSIENYCARKIYRDLADKIDSVEFENEDQRNWFMGEAKDEPFALYEFESQSGPYFDLRIFKEIVDFNYDFPGRWFQFVRTLKKPNDIPNKENILEFRKHIFRQLKACGCNEAYYFADQGPGELLYNILDKPAKEWIDYLEKGEFISDGKPKIIEIPKHLDNSIQLSDNDWIDCFIDDFSDFKV
ncbi:MAG: hypothetical protein HDS42_03325 [Bacteroides sp.]|nr:hypothetical protein [Bacteroides sp.]